ncbi:helix-turn-helix domain-containing protein [Streptomyces sp. NPDC047061]|uniref:PucR family transcriptional regulator n=1 Tax=Streptomyces sp. NPDC047061 TaxID=3154605 RepID=UPI0033F42A31
MHDLSRPVAESSTARRVRRIIQCLDADMVARQVAPVFPAAPAGRLGDDSDQAVSWENLIRRSAELISHWMASGIQPGQYTLSELYEAARAVAGSGLAAEDAFRVCSATARALWGVLLRSVPAEDWGCLPPHMDVLWAFLDIASRTIKRAFDDHRELLSSSDNYRAGTLFVRICDRSPATIEDHDRADRLGFRFAEFYSPFVVAMVGGSAASHSYLAARLRATGALAYAEGHRVAGLTGPDFDWRTFLDGHSVSLATYPPTRQDSLAEAVSELHDLVTLAARSGYRGQIHPEDFLAEMFLTNSPRLAERILERVFGRLEDQDDSGVLSATLTCLAANVFDRAATASALPVHRNTLLYRINRIEKLSGLDLDRHTHRELVRLAAIWKDGRISQFG